MLAIKEKQHINITRQKHNIETRNNGDFISFLEFQGSGHYIDGEEKVKERDEIKKKVVLKAGLRIYILNGEDIYNKNNFIDELKLQNAINDISDTLNKWFQNK